MIPLLATERTAIKNAIDSVETLAAKLADNLQQLNNTLPLLGASTGSIAEILDYLDAFHAFATDAKAAIGSLPTYQQIVQALKGMSSASFGTIGFAEQYRRGGDGKLELLLTATLTSVAHLTPTFDFGTVGQDIGLTIDPISAVSATSIAIRLELVPARERDDAAPAAPCPLCVGAVCAVAMVRLFLPPACRAALAAGR